ncbi:uncharacterized protein LOC115481726 [Microcaecilia unicolor]|uniref:Uncharacterized protein LOC115481726 n=1 Tax=Microcaecilia unicolor TaxID=1415580 RepID=A0A6P7ZGA6_9AMPH|nr:uncharacterized protein LOC115481726 [Microcaecilia unicolor]
MFPHGSYRQGRGGSDWSEGHKSSFPRSWDVDSSPAPRSWGNWDSSHDYETRREHRGYREERSYRERRGFRENGYREQRDFLERGYRDQRGFCERRYNEGSSESRRDYEQHTSYQKQHICSKSFQHSETSYESQDTSHGKRIPTKNYKKDTLRSVRCIKEIPSQGDNSLADATEGKDPEKKYTGDKKSWLNIPETTTKGGESDFAVKEVEEKEVWIEEKSETAIEGGEVTLGAEEKPAWINVIPITTIQRGGGDTDGAGEGRVLIEIIPESITQKEVNADGGGEEQASINVMVPETATQSGRGDVDDGTGEKRIQNLVIPESTIEGGKNDSDGPGEKRAWIKEIPENVTERREVNTDGAGEKQAWIKEIPQSTIEGGKNGSDRTGEKQAWNKEIPENIIEGGRNGTNRAGEKRTWNKKIPESTVKGGRNVTDGAGEKRAWILERAVGGGGDGNGVGPGEKRARIEMPESTIGGRCDIQVAPGMAKVICEENRVGSSSCQPCSTLGKETTRDPRSVAILARKEAIELAYQHDCRAFVFVASMLLEKEPAMQTTMVSAVRASLRELGRHCVHELKGFIERYDVNSGGHAMR